MYFKKHDVFVIIYAIAYMIVHLSWVLSAIAGEHSRVEFLTVIDLGFVVALGLYVFFVLEVFKHYGNRGPTNE